MVNPAGSIVPAKGGGGLGEDVGGEGDRVLNPLEEVQLLLTIHARLEEQENVKLRYCIFDAIFSEADEENKVGVVCGEVRNYVLSWSRTDYL